MATFLVLIAVVLPTVLIVEKLADETTALYGWLNEKQSLEGGWGEYIGSIVNRPSGGSHREPECPRKS